MGPGAGLRSQLDGRGKTLSVVVAMTKYGLYFERKLASFNLIFLNLIFFCLTYFSSCENDCGYRYAILTITNIVIITIIRIISLFGFDYD